MLMTATMMFALLAAGTTQDLVDESFENEAQEVVLGDVVAEELDDVVLEDETAEVDAQDCENEVASLEE